MRKFASAMNGNTSRWIISGILGLVVVLLGAWAQETNATVRSHTDQISELRRDNAVVQAKLDLLLSAHGINFVDEKNLVLRGKKTPRE